MNRNLKRKSKAFVVFAGGALILGIALSSGLNFPPFRDEPFYLEYIGRFAEAFPNIDFVKDLYGVGPVPYIIWMIVYRFFPGVVALRLTSVISILISFIIYALILNENKKGKIKESVLLLLLIPFVLSYSIQINALSIGLCFSMASLFFFLKGKNGSLLFWITGSIFSTLAILSYQQSSVIPAAACIWAILSIRKLNKMAKKVIWVVAPLIPFIFLGFLVIQWHGLLPPTYCAKAEISRIIHFENLSLFLVYTGFYFWPILIFYNKKTFIRNMWGVLLGLIALFFCLPYGPRAANGIALGLLFRLSNITLRCVYPIGVVLVACIGGMVLARIVLLKKDRTDWFVIISLGFFLIISLGLRYPFERYHLIAIVLTLILFSRKIEEIPTLFILQLLWMGLMSGLYLSNILGCQIWH